MIIFTPMYIGGRKRKIFSPAPLPPYLLKRPDVVKMAFGDGLVRVW
jgi:hypothetical protein